MPRVSYGNNRRLQIFPDADGYIYTNPIHTEPAGRLQGHQIRDAGPVGRCIAVTRTCSQRLSIAVKFGFLVFFCARTVEYALLIGYPDTRTMQMRASHSSICPRNFWGILNPTARFIFPVFLQMMLIWGVIYNICSILYCSEPLYLFKAIQFVVNKKARWAEVDESDLL